MEMKSLAILFLVMVSVTGGCKKSKQNKDYKGMCVQAGAYIEQCNPNMFLSQPQEVFVAKCSSKAKKGSKKYIGLVECLAESSGDCSKVENCIVSFKKYRDPLVKPVVGKNSIKPWELATNKERCRSMIDSLMKCIPEMAKVFKKGDKMSEEFLKKCEEEVIKTKPKQLKEMLCVYENPTDCAKIKKCIKWKEPKKRAKPTIYKNKPTGVIKSTKQDKTTNKSGLSKRQIDKKCTNYATVMVKCAGKNVSARTESMFNMCKRLVESNNEIGFKIISCTEKFSSDCDAMQKCFANMAKKKQKK
jgi:hypothetical protein